MSELNILLITAASVGFLHTVLGPDHYLPFVALSRSRQWSWGKTTLVTALCGLGHVLSSVVIGFIGIALGIALSRLEQFESLRGDVAGWLLLGFGIAYMVWGIVRAVKNRPHTHLHVHADGVVHEHTHTHTGDHAHVHESNSTTLWVLFIIFVFGPCEPLIPLLMYPASKQSMFGVVMVTTVFATVTIATMLAMVLLLSLGVELLPLKRLERYAHAIAGGVILLSGLAVVLGL